MLLNILIKAAVVYISFHLLWRVFKHSRFANLAGPPSSSWFFGNIPQLFNPNGWNFHYGILKKYGTTMTIKGALGEPMVLTCDPKALHHILVKDQLIYEASISDIFFGEGLLSTFGEQHRKQRKMLNPVFSINHMREMIPLFYEVTNRLRAALKKKLDNGPKEIDVLHWTSRTALELIGQSGMGFSFDSLVDDDDYHPYRTAVQNLVTVSTGPLMFYATQYIFPLAKKFDYPRVKRFIAERIPLQRAQGLIHIIDVMRQTSIEIIEEKKKVLMDSDPAVVAEMESKKDIISILMRANTTVSEEDRLSDEEVIGQVSTLVFAAMDTTSSALARILWLLSEHPDVQDRMRDEIREAQKNDELSYDQLVSLPYLDAVCRETLRVYPPVSFAALRNLRKDTVLPFSKPVLDSNGKEVTEIFLRNGTKVIVSLLGANTNPDIWGADSYEWKPERWLSQLPETVAGAHMPGVYSHVMTFLGGGRACLGFKFSQLEMKVVLSVLLASFRFGKFKSKPVVWKMTGIASPMVEGGDGKSRELPLLLSLVD
ncbi:hypothetical protein AGABI2DRAFT_179443 [Agaricus bisporus var. bisporus H97]|uniref:hypothetical protein n=1 Tax=Agaricus bisporus var. bisporus (strain H97 / ATCC MYA-4626 / FGSC 10389) TaxID=936046 RepID=UPI00029F6444|nr:hypothetical protein AGABI2DRAFT_179443 [Agaricus bisporus var. bisporus H97]EKV46014.1 hypothetical protein AGABI2DRAFT_179443 [Agaricus bisporus var. bisporus H97]